MFTFRTNRPQSRSTELRQAIARARSEKRAIGHFNISDIQGFWAVINAARRLSSEVGKEIPVIIGVSEGERDFIGVPQVKALVDSVRTNGEQVFLNADHTYSFERVKEVVDAGFDAFIYDGTEQSFDDNVAATKKCASYARGVQKNIVIEAELGFIGKSSKVLDAIPEGVKISEEFLTKPEDADRFAQASGVDLLAPAVGNIHGMLKGGANPALNIARIKAIAQTSDMPLVLHGGSGNSDDDFRAAIDAGVVIIHVNTEIRAAYRTSLQKTLVEKPDEVAPYKFFKPSVVAMEDVIYGKLKVFNRIGESQA